MALDLDDIKVFEDFHSCNKPHGTDNYNLKILTHEQQIELNKVKADVARRCHAYLAKNDKYVRGIIIVILRYVLRIRPKRNVLAFIGKFFRKTSLIDIEDQIIQYAQDREKTVMKIVYEDVLDEVFKTEAMKNFMRKKQSRIESIKLAREIVGDMVLDVPVKADFIMVGRTVDELWSRAQAQMDESDRIMERTQKIKKVMDKIINKVFSDSIKAQCEDIVAKLVSKVVILSEDSDGKSAFDIAEDPNELVSLETIDTILTTNTTITMDAESRHETELSVALETPEDLTGVLQSTAEKDETEELIFKDKQSSLEDQINLTNLSISTGPQTQETEMFTFASDAPKADGESISISEMEHRSDFDDVNKLEEFQVNGNVKVETIDGIKDETQVNLKPNELQEEIQNEKTDITATVVGDEVHVEGDIDEANVQVEKVEAPVEAIGINVKITGDEVQIEGDVDKAHVEVNKTDA